MDTASKLRVIADWIDTYVGYGTDQAEQLRGIALDLAAAETLQAWTPPLYWGALTAGEKYGEYLRWRARMEGAG